MRTQNLIKMNINEAKETAIPLYKTYKIMADMTYADVTPLANASANGVSYKEYQKIRNQFDKQNQIHNTYFNLSITCFDIAICKRRGKKIIRDLEAAVEEAEELGLNVY